MSRSAPTQNNPNPCARWLNWKGGDGKLNWYDKDAKARVDVPNGFKFLVLDTLSTVTGYNDKKKDGVTANEVRDVRTDPLLVKFFKSGEIANGLWANIKKEVAYEDGQFAASVYIAFRENKDAPLEIGNIKMSGCALGPWFDFKKKHQSEINDKAVVMKAGEEVTTGTGRSAIVFTPPAFSISEVSAETNAEAVELDKQLQDFLKGYLKTPIADKLDQRTGHQVEDENQDYEEADAAASQPARRAPDPDLDAPEEDDIPF